MQTMNLIPGTADWHAHRAHHRNASDAPAALGCSPYTTRAELLRRMHTGVSAEVDAGTQRRFDDGHRFEALARPLAEQIIGDDLAPVVGVLEGTKLSASFDGLTLMGDTAWEHKTLNDDLRACMRDQGNGYDLPKHYRIQMEQQLLVSGAERVLFMATKWTPSGELVEERHCWYASDPALRAEIVAGWEQFEADLAAYQPAPAQAAVVAAPVQALPAVAVQVAGEIAIRHNFDAFEVALRDFLEHRLIRQPKTDQDFADLDVQIKAMKGAEAALESAEQNWIAQIEAVGNAKRTKDMLHKLVRDNRLMAEKLLSSEKERRRGEIVAGGISALREHVDGWNTRLGKAYMPPITADFAGAIRGKKSLANMEDAVAVELARARAQADQVGAAVLVNLSALRELAKDHAFLFADAAQLVLKAPDDCRAVITSRIAEHKAEQERRLEADRARIRAEEEAKARAAAAREQQEREAEERRQQEAAARAATPAPTPAPAPIAPPAVSSQAPAASAPADNVVPIQRQAAASTATIRLGQISERLGFALTAEFVGQLGYHPVAMEKAAKLYRLSDFDLICEALIAHVRTVQAKQLQAA